MDGFLNLNKPAGFTSHDCVARLRKLLHTKRVGHGGTLDPAATGVLPIAVGRATRLLQYLPEGKAYRATIRFGTTTDTDDLEGNLLSQTDASLLTLEAVTAIRSQFLGQIQQVPPSYSAIQVGGRRLYDLARSGESVIVPVRSVQIDRLEILDWRPGAAAELDVAIACGPGTYIRSIARDWGEAVGTGGTLAKLERTASCGMAIAASLTLADVADRLALVAAATPEKSPRESNISDALLLSPPQALDLPVLTLSAETAPRWQQGQKIPLELIALDAIAPESLTSGSFYQVHYQAQFLGIGVAIDSEAQRLLKPKLVWN